MSSRPAAIQLAVCLLLAISAHALAATLPQPHKQRPLLSLPVDASARRSNHVHSSSSSSNRQQHRSIVSLAASNNSAMVQGDIIAAGAIPVLNGTAYRSVVVVLDGKTSQVKADWTQLLVDASNNTDYPAYFAISAPGVRPDNKQMTLLWSDAQTGVNTIAFVDITNTSMPNITGKWAAPLPWGIESMQYTRSGDVLATAYTFGPGIGNDTVTNSTIFRLSSTTGSLMAQYTYQVQGNRLAYRMDITTDGSTLLWPNTSSVVQTFNLTSSAYGPNFATIPGTSCKSVLAQYDGSAILGCYNEAEGNCVYLVNGTSSANATTAIIRKRCLPSDGFVDFTAMAMDVDRQHFYVNVVREGIWNGSTPSAPSVYKIRVSDFQVVSSAASSMFWYHATVFGAVPANQQDCPVGFGQCCSPAGLPLSNGTTCMVSRNPCKADSTCTGLQTTCPRKKKVKNGTPCSLNPAGLFNAASDAQGRMGASASISSIEAQSKGYHKCSRCYQGECLTYKTKSNKHKAHHHHKHGNKKYEEASTTGYTSNSQEPSQEFYCH